MALVRAINRLFQPRYLLVTNIGSCAVLMGLGDAAVQCVEKATGASSQPYDWRRTVRLATTGLMLGPFNHYWYSMLDRVLPAVTIQTVGKKILADQTVAAPFFAFTFFMGTGILEGQSVKNSWKEFTSKFWGVYKADWALWPAAQAINFGFVPGQFRVVYVCGITLCWNTFLSYYKHKDQLKKKSLNANKIHKQ